MNSKAIADAIALTFAGTTATSGGVTESLVACTATLPNALAKGPALLVFHPSGELGLSLSRRRDDTLTFPVRLLRDPLNVPQRSDFLYAWYDAIRDKPEANMDLDLAYVAWARATAATLEVDGFTYAGVLFDMVELTVTVRLDEVVSSVGA
jgi:hypothetical protein